ncbi:MAG TPA: aminoacyl-histidine dipeptidase [Ignavibacteriales bacterium]|nr:aminoacyl-histidine dipeptidase [Ignavibacteriales bacterium]
MGHILGSLKPELLWNHFEEICSYPRPSRKEEKVAEYVMSVGSRNGLETIKDSFGNVLIRKPATPGMENLKPVVLQGHLDMVAEKNNDVQHDFDNDPITPYIDGDWVKAKGTTLGSDNGIGVAAALTIMESKDVQHGPIEFLFTLDEETGLFGAQSLKPGFLKAEILLNLDSEEDGTFYIGCAGGKNSFVNFKYKKEEPEGRFSYFDVSVKGLKGGHSGLEIHVGKGNAIKIMSRILFNAMQKFDARLSKLDGGSKHNAIPREAFATVAIKKSAEEKFVKMVKDLEKTIKAEYATMEPDLKISTEKIKKAGKILNQKAAKNLVTALLSVPNGVDKMSPDIPGLVQTSSNLAVIKTEDKNIAVTLSHRSSVESEKNEVADRIAALFTLAGAEVESGDGYPGWQPNIHSDSLKVSKSVYENLFHSEPEIKAIHAGLECGIIKEKFPNMDMISFGPTIIGAHSPDEKVQISAVEKFWNLLVNILKNIPNK